MFLRRSFSGCPERSEVPRRGIDGAVPVDCLLGRQAFLGGARKRKAGCEPFPLVAKKIKGESSSIENDRNRHPHEVCGYGFGNHSALEWTLDQVQKKETQRPNYPREVQHLPVCGLQGEGDRAADAHHDCERDDCRYR